MITNCQLSASHAFPEPTTPPYTAQSGSHHPDDVLVRAENVSKKFCRSLKKSLWYGLKDIAHELNPFSRDETVGFHASSGSYSSALRDDEFWAVNNVSLELRRGECLGLIGHNGAGKTTLLKMLNGLIKPDVGRIEMRGRVGALIALGAGFNPILTGRENIYVNASVLGLSNREIDEKLDEIVDFAEVGEFIDSPVQSYSSGMQVRLGFAVATALNPDILILDEVLAVGDASFRSKCLLRISRLLSNCAVIFVSHQESQIGRICNRVLLLERGAAIACGAPSEILPQYRLATMHQHRSVDIAVDNMCGIQSVEVKCAPVSMRSGSSLSVFLQFTCKFTIEPDAILVAAVDSEGAIVAQTLMPIIGTLAGGEMHRIEAQIQNLCLKPGRYSINMNLFRDNGRIFMIRVLNGAEFIVSDAPFASLSSYQPQGVARLICDPEAELTR